MRVTIFGAGYVGLVAGACLASSGRFVCMVDTDRSKLEVLQTRKAPFHEPGLDDLISDGVLAGRLTFAAAETFSDYGDVIVIAVGTPAAGSGAADLRYVRGVADRIVKDRPTGSTVIMKSTVPPGTGAMVAARLSEVGVGYVSSPEFLREGSAVHDWFHTDRIVIGGDEASVERARQVYDGIDAPFVICDVTSAEMVKYASNAFLATKVSFINEIATLCDRVGANIDVVAEGLGRDSRIGRSFLGAGIGYGGSCFPKDTRALDFLSTMNGYDFHLLKAVIEVNARQRLLPLMALRGRFGALDGKRVAVLGLTFKPDTDDTRESPGRDIMELLLADGAAVCVYDPVGVLSNLPTDVTVAGSVAEAVANADAAIVATEWKDITDADWTVLASTMADDAVVFDGRNAISPEAVRAAGRAYVGVGRR